MSTEMPIEPPTGTTVPKPRPGTRWRCTKCDATMITALPAKQVLCATCNKRLGVNKVWMHNDD